MQLSEPTESQPVSDQKSSPEICENRLSQMNLGKDQILNQDLNQLRQSIVSINSLMIQINNDFLKKRKDENIYNLDFDINAALLILIQRKSFIVHRYKTILKRDIINEIRETVGELVDDQAKQKLDHLITRLEYIESNKPNFTGKLHSLI